MDETNGMSDTPQTSTSEERPVALISGASSGIGAACAQLLAQKDYRLILCGRNAERLEAVAALCRQNTEVLPLMFDVRSRAETEQALRRRPDNWQAVDVLINNAGNAHGQGPFHENEPEDWDAMIDGNVQGLLYVSREIVPGMVERGRGHLVNISSIAGKSVYAGGAVYCASKAAVEALSEGLRLDLTPHGIRVTNIAPGAVATGFSGVRYKGDRGRAEAVYRGFDPLLASDIADAVWYAISAPANVCIADITLLAAAQSAATVIHRKT